MHPPLSSPAPFTDFTHWLGQGDPEATESLKKKEKLHSEVAFNDITVCQNLWNTALRDLKN